MYLRLSPIALAHPIPGHGASELVMTFLDEFLLDLPHLAFDDADLVRYAIAAFRNFLKQVLRNDGVRERRYDRAAESSDGAQETIVAECHSAYSLGAASGVVRGEAGGGPLDDLGRHLAAGLSDMDRELLRGLSRGAPVKEVAAWLGLDYGACRVRIHRLRVRLRVDAIAYAEAADPPRRLALDRFFRRLGIQSRGDGERKNDR